MDSRRSSQTFTKLPSAHSHHEDDVDGEAYKYDIHARLYPVFSRHEISVLFSSLSYLTYSVNHHPDSSSRSPSTLFLIPHRMYISPPSSVLSYSYPISQIHPLSSTLSHPSSLILPLSSILSHPSFLILPLSSFLSHPTSTYHPSFLIPISSLLDPQSNSHLLPPTSHLPSL
jgi:hypothetical protein